MPTQSYFAVQTIRQEVADQLTDDEKRIELLEGSLELAERSFDEVIRHSEKLNLRERLARGCWELGVTLKLRGATDSAMVHLKRAAEIYEELGMRREADEVRVNLGIVGSPAS